MDQRKYISIVRYSSLFGIAVGLLVMTAWVLDIEFLKSVAQGRNTMKFNTALCLGFLGSATLLTVNDRHRPSSLVSCILIIIAGLTLSQDLFNYTTPLDELFVKDSGSHSDANAHPGRMSPTVSLSFILMSLALLNLRSRRTSLKVLAQYILHFVTLISFIAILGYIYGVPSFYKLTFFVSMAFHTAITFFVLSISLALLNPRLGLAGVFTGDEIGSVMARRIFTLAGAAILVLGFAGLEIGRRTVTTLEFEISLFTTCFFILCLLIIANTVKHINSVDQQRSKAEHSLKTLNRTLEDKVKTRTEELARSEDKFVKIFEMSPAGLIVSDLDTGVYLDVNQSFVALTGYTKEEAVGKTTAELGLISPEDREQRLNRISGNGGLKDLETIYFTKAGERRNAVLSVELVAVDGKKLALAALYDITELKIVERELTAAKHLAEESSVAKERFMANMSHEIRTPMNAIIGFTNLIEHTPLDKEQQQYLNFIKNSGENLLVLINDILDYSKIEAGMMTLEQVPFNIADLMQSLSIMFGNKATEKHLDLITHIADDIPSTLVGDPTRLTQILINLVGNAIKFTHKGSIEVGIRLVSSDTANLRIAISVRDTGIGIPKDKQKDVFERFMQASSETTRNYGGTGLGLSIVKRLVELQKGEIRIESEEGRGTEFYLELPYTVSKDNVTSVGHIPAPVVEMKPFEPALNVLLAEDHIMNQLLAKKVLSQFGCEVDVAENGQVAVEMAANNAYDLILMDIQMPLMDGYTAALLIRKAGNKVPIIAMTAHVMAGEREKCISMGMNDYISKPFKIDNLYLLISKYAGTDRVQVS